MLKLQHVPGYNYMRSLSIRTEKITMILVSYFYIRCNYFIYFHLISVTFVTYCYQIFERWTSNLIFQLYQKDKSDSENSKLLFAKFFKKIDKFSYFKLYLHFKSGFNLVSEFIPIEISAFLKAELSFSESPK
jgi:hypothetical protein